MDLGDIIVFAIIGLMLFGKFLPGGKGGGGSSKRSAPVDTQ